MGYSKIKSIQLINFMGYTNSTAMFDDSGILLIKGYNSAGKSALLTGCAVALMNIFPGKQVKYIKHDMDYFRIIVTFDDGVIIVRDKYKNGQSLYEMYVNEKLVFTTKSGDKLSKVDDVPEKIANYLGLISTELGFLNYQTRRDPLWLVETKGSENYLTLNEVLKTEEIARANALLNSDKNQLNADITQTEATRQSVQMQLDSMTGCGEDLLNLLYEREAIASEVVRKYNALYNIVTIIESLEAIKDIPNVTPIGNLDKLGILVKLSGNISQIESFNVFSEDVEKVDTTRLSKIQALVGTVEKVESQSDYFEEEITKIVDIDKYPNLGRIQTLLKDYVKTLEDIESLKADESLLIEERDEVVKQADAEGFKFIVCDNCGTLLEVEK